MNMFMNMFMNLFTHVHREMNMFTNLFTPSHTCRPVDPAVGSDFDVDTVTNAHSVIKRTFVTGCER